MLTGEAGGATTVLELLVGLNSSRSHTCAESRPAEVHYLVPVLSPRGASHPSRPTSCLTLKVSKCRAKGLALLGCGQPSTRCLTACRMELAGSSGTALQSGSIGYSLKPMAGQTQTLRNWLKSLPYPGPAGCQVYSSVLFGKNEQIHAMPRASGAGKVQKFGGGSEIVTSSASPWGGCICSASLVALGGSGIPEKAYFPL